MASRLYDRNNDNNNDDGDGYANNDTHLHVFPPHVLANPVCTTTEALGRDCEVI